METVGSFVPPYVYGNACRPIKVAAAALPDIGGHKLRLSLRQRGCDVKRIACADKYR